MDSLITQLLMWIIITGLIVGAPRIWWEFLFHAEGGIDAVGGAGDRLGL